MLHWSVIKDKRPKTDGHVAVAVGKKVFFFGGHSDQIVVHIFNAVSLRWVKLPPVTTGRGEHPLEVAPKRSGHTVVWIDVVVYLWGGCPYSNALYTFDVNTHRWLKPKMSGTVPGARRNHSACVLGKVMYVFGGCTQQLARYTNDIYKLDTTTMVWSLINAIGTLPPASRGHSATILGTKMFVFGGEGDQGECYNIIRVFDTETNSWLSTPSAQLLPEGRWDHSAFAYNGELYIFGGRSWDQTFSDVWKFNPETFSWKKVEPMGKGPWSAYGMCCCMVGDSIIIFGGYVNTPDDVYILDLSLSEHGT